MKRSMIIVIFVMLFCVLSMACTKGESEITSVEEYSQQLYEVNQTCISTKVNDVSMETDQKGTATITVQLPNYEEIFLEAYAKENPDEALLKSLKSGKYNTCSYEITAEVTIEDGEEVIHSDDAIEKLLEQELSKATKAMQEVSEK